MKLALTLQQRKIQKAEPCQDFSMVLQSPTFPSCHSGNPLQDFPSTRYAVLKRGVPRTGIIHLKVAGPSSVLIARQEGGRVDLCRLLTVTGLLAPMFLLTMVRSRILCT